MKVTSNVSKKKSMIGPVPMKAGIYVAKNEENLYAIRSANKDRFIIWDNVMDDGGNSEFIYKWERLPIGESITITQDD